MRKSADSGVYSLCRVIRDSKTNEAKDYEVIGVGTREGVLNQLSCYNGDINIGVLPPMVLLTDGEGVCPHMSPKDYAMYIRTYYGIS